MKYQKLKVLTLLLGVVFVSISAFGQDAPPVRGPKNNYVRTIGPRVETQSIPANPSKEDYIIGTSYFDGLGRPVQQIMHSGSPTAKDVVTNTRYDFTGRVYREYLPYTQLAATPGERRTDWLTEIGSFYAPNNDHVSESTHYYAEPVYEASLLGRMKKGSAPGATWKSDGNHTVDYTYTVNDTTDLVEELVVNNRSNTVTNLGLYADGALAKEEVSDENNGANEGQTITFTNTLGQVVLKKVKSDGNNYLYTYYVYDDFNNLRFVLPPAGVAEILDNNNWGLVNNDSFREKWMFCYEYDGRNRMIGKRVPGSDWMYMIYDQKDRLVLTQDGNQRAGNVEGVDGHLEIDAYRGKSYQLNNGASITLKPEFHFKAVDNSSFEASFDEVTDTKKWIFTKYDELSRPVMTGFYYDARERAAIQNEVDSKNNLTEAYDSKTAAFQGYGNSAFPTAIEESEMLTVTYYDDYEFTDEVVPSIANVVVLNTVNGQVTGAKTKVLGTDQWLESVTFYDDRYRPVKILSDNHKGGYDIVENTYRNTVSNLIEMSVMTHTSTDYGNVNTKKLRTTEEFTYDHMDRLLTHTQQITAIDGATEIDQPLVVLSSNHYNEISELKTKNIGNYLQNVDYAYNIRGWLTKINDGTDLSGFDKFGMELQYNQAGQYNGNIGKMSWKSLGGNGVNTNSQEFSYAYDALSRLKSATYSSINLDNNFNVSGITYDANGNILTLNRNQNAGGLLRTIDKLVYNYGEMGNQLQSVTDNSTAQADLGFADGNTTGIDYKYDDNGNMMKDANKEISNISYNHLNLPEVVTFENGDHVRYLYDAAGIKLQKEAEISKVTTVTDYIAGKHYRNGDLEFFQHAEGRVVYNAGSFDYEYNLTDHLGNVRVTIKEGSADPIVSTETTTYAFDNSDTGAPLTLGSNAILTGGKLKINGLAGTSDESRSVSTTIQVDPGDEVSISVSFVNGSEIIATGQVEGEFGLMNGSLLLDSKKTGVDPSGNLNINYTAVAKGSLEVYLKVSQYNGTDETPEFSYDNLSIAVTSTSRDVIVIQKDDYYPFGLTFQSWQLNPPKNQYGFQGQEYQEEIGWHQYKWRNADPALGRFFNVDPLAEKYHYWTPYAFSGNMVIRFVELEGLEPAYPDMQESLTQAFGRGALNFVTSTAESVWFLMKASNPYTLERQQLKKGINQGATGLFTFLADPASGLEAVASHADTEFETFRRASDQERAIMLTEFGGEVVAGAAFEGAVGPLLKSLDVAGDVAKITKSMDNIPGMSQADISKVLAGNWGGEFFYKGIGSQKAIDHIWDLHSFTNRQAGKSYFLGKYNSKGKLKNLVADARAKARSNHNAGILRDDGKRVFRVEMDGFIGVDRSGRQTRIMTIIEENGRYNNSFPGTL